MSTRGAMTTLRRRLLGVAFLMTIVLFLSLTVATYQRAFTSSVDVVLHTASVGNQLMADSDVKVRGMIVGRVREIEPTADGAKLHLALEPDKASRLPANVSARLLPRTLFGERYVSLEVPENSSGAVLASGDVIEQDRSSAAVELETVLADTMPVLQAVHPDELAVTLNSLSQALEGRGRPLGETLSQLNTYLDGLNPSVPDLRENLRELVGVAETYEDAAPDVLEALENLSTTSRTLVEQKDDLSALTSQLTTTSQDATRFFQDNGKNLIRLGEAQRPTLDVLAKYSPEYTCFLNQMHEFVPTVRKAFGEGTSEPGLHITLEVVANRGKYVPNQDEPEFADKRGPRCYDIEPLPDPVPEYPPDGPFEDGSVPPPASRPVDGGLLPPSMGEQYLPAGNAPASTSPQSAGGLGMVNSPMERDFISALLAPSMGVAPAQVPGWGSLLGGPVLRGAEVSYR
ncbi:MCE family protein [Saccharopolyspora erythraea]|uniref:Mce family protein n=2 Tax=Saccharopolyspora erythraea TaxID=1836 RepID=A4FPQ2_SACEN|nr:MCE family protein [Saccharopolyspora erythraea]EQD86912.1 ABC transporter substrate-binding protein [Saccharopolyspora erythraea D]QRK89558.1 MCE family protein [Saccharopolyspora erythraea]CAM06027.1 putative Mce family protein [Saccharopolyspora erythraea NRRL 2338]